MDKTENSRKKWTKLRITGEKMDKTENERQQKSG